MTSNSRVSFQEICEYPVLENLHRACVHIIGHFFLFFFLLCSRNWLLVVTVGWCLFCFRFSEEKKKRILFILGARVTLNIVHRSRM